MLSGRLLIPTTGLMLLLFVPGLALLAPPRPGESWVRHDAPQEPTWPDQPRYTSDGAPEPVPAGEVVLVASARRDALTAIDARTGHVRWRYVAEGPFRTAPAVWQDRAFVACDDGCLHCLDVATGKLLWKFRGGPGPRRILGNERLICTWPARGGAVVAQESDGQATVYFAAGIWPFMGIFLHAVDATTGAVRWTNSGEGDTYIKQPHQTDAFAGIAPQGSLVVEGDNLLVPGGRSIPACFDRHTGKRTHYRLADASKLGGGPDVWAGTGVYVNGGGGFALEDGSYLGPIREPHVIADDKLYSVAGTTLRVFDLTARPDREPPAPKDKSKEKEKAKKKPADEESWLGKPVATVKLPMTAVTALAAQRGRVFAAGSGLAVTVTHAGTSATVVRKQPLAGTPLHLAIGEEHVFASTREGRLYALTPFSDAPRVVPADKPRPAPAATPAQAAYVRDALRASGSRQGYAVVYGVGSGGVPCELLRQGAAKVVVVEPDEDKAARFRERLLDAAIDPARLAVVHASPATAGLPPYFAEVMLCENADAADLDLAFDLDAVFGSLRPYGGAFCVPASTEAAGHLRAFAPSRADAGKPTVEESDGLAVLRRAGALPGAGQWTHQHGDAANTRVSDDDRVKTPLGLLWFGGPGNDGILPRHGHGPVPQVCDGRLVIEGPDKLRCIDVYTGRLLWERRLPGLGKPYDNTAHQPGANAMGSNYVSQPDAIYVAYRDACLCLDPQTGKTLRQLAQRPMPGAKVAADWTFLTVADTIVVAGAGASGLAKDPKKPHPVAGKAYPASTRLSVLDRATGKTLGEIPAKYGFRHNGIVVGGGRLYAIDRDDAPADKKKLPAARIVAFDLKARKTAWVVEKDVFGTWLSYSAEHDVLVEAGLMSRDTLADEPAGMRAYAGKTGKAMWFDKDYFGPALVQGGRIFKGGDARAGSGTACDLLTGKPATTSDPLTGEKIEWRWTRTYGCNTPAASKHLMLFRSGAAGFFDLTDDGGTGNLGGFRSSCTLNLIAAGGVLTVPDYTRTCTCAYQNQTSVGLVHMPEADLWTYSTKRDVKGVVTRLGLNLGAPGSRKAADGTLWLEHPPAGGPSPKVAVTTIPAAPAAFRMHSSQAAGEGPGWVAASGLRDLRSLTLSLGKDAKGPRRYTVRLTFLEPDGLEAGQRRFDVAIQGEPVLNNFDVSREAGGPGRAVVRTIRGVEVMDKLSVYLIPARDAAVAEPVLSGVEVVREP